MTYQHRGDDEIDQVGSGFRHALRTADEAFLSSTAGGIMPVTKVDGKMLGDGRPEPISWRLRERYWSKREAGWLGTAVRDLIVD